MPVELFLTDQWLIFSVLVLFLTLSAYLIRSEKIKHELQKTLRLKQSELKKFSDIDHLKSCFFANISHEIRTRLTLISGPLEFIKIN